MISIVVPAFNEEAGIHMLHERLTSAAAAWNEDYEIVIVDDGSRDRTEICKEIAAAIRIFGFLVFRAISAIGRRHCRFALLLRRHRRGDGCRPLGSPRRLIRFIQKCREGFDVVYAIRTKRKENIFKRSSYFLYYRLLKKMAALDIPLDAGDFYVMGRSVSDALNDLPERNRFVRGLRTWVGYRQTGLAYERHGRQSGEPKYTFSKPSSWRWTASLVSPTSRCN